jgi:excisionase family DNA binding protein
VSGFCYSAAQLAREWGCSVRHVYDLCSRRELGHIRIGGLIRIRPEDKATYEARQWVAPSAAGLVLSVG